LPVSSFLESGLWGNINQVLQEHVHIRSSELVLLPDIIRLWVEEEEEVMVEEAKQEKIPKWCFIWEDIESNWKFPWGVLES